jgi:predicted negative regulator of RcsB-dependent stress response
MTTPRPHGDTDTRLEGFEARLQDGFAWANDHGREIVIAIAVFVVVGGIAAGVHEWRKRDQAETQTELARIEARYTAAMGANPGELYISEPANADQAKAARETAIGELDAFIAAHGESEGSSLAAIRAAELEIDLQKNDAAAARLDALVQSLDGDDPRRAVALRLRGYLFDAKGEPLAAAESYEAAAKVESYPPRGLAWIAAGDCFARANQPERAVAAYRQALATAPEVSEQEGIVARLGIQQAKLDAAASAAAPQPAAPAPPATSDK